MDDLEKQFFANDDNLESQFFAEQPKEETKRGANFGGVLRNVASATPFLGPWADEAEAGLRAAKQYIYNIDPTVSKEKKSDKTWKELYDVYKKNAEESAKGNIENTGYGKALNIGTNIAENAVLGAATLGATLMPGLSGVQGTIEGFGKGDNWRDRTENAILEGTISTAVPVAFNRILPTKTVQDAMLKSATNSKNALKSIIGKSILQKTTPEDVIAREIPKGMRADLWSNIRRNSVGEDIMRRVVQKQASDVVSMPYEEYIVKEVKGVAPKYASKLGRAMEKLKLDQLADDLVGEFDPRSVVMDAVNNVMKGAPQAMRETVGQTVSDAVAKRGVAKKLTSATIERPISTGSGSIWNFLRRASSPLRNMYDYGTMRALTVGTPNYIPSNTIEQLFNWYTPNVVRGGLDALVEESEKRSLK